MKPQETPTADAPTTATDRDREDRYRRAAGLIREWQADESGYDDEIWPLVEEEIPNLRTRCSE